MQKITAEQQMTPSPIEEALILQNTMSNEPNEVAKDEEKPLTPASLPPPSLPPPSVPPPSTPIQQTLILPQSPLMTPTVTIPR